MFEKFFGGKSDKVEIDPQHTTPEKGKKFIGNIIGASAMAFVVATVADKTFEKDKAQKDVKENIEKVSDSEFWNEMADSSIRKSVFPLRNVVSLEHRDMSLKDYNEMIQMISEQISSNNLSGEALNNEQYLAIHARAVEIAAQKGVLVGDIEKVSKKVYSEQEYTSDTYSGSYESFGDSYSDFGSSYSYSDYSDYYNNSDVDYYIGTIDLGENISKKVIPNAVTKIYVKITPGAEEVKVLENKTQTIEIPDNDPALTEEERIIRTN